MASRRGRSSVLAVAAPAVLAAAACAWALLVVFSPYLVTRFATGDLRFRLGALVYLAGGVVCHQRAARSFHGWGAQLPVCGRCTGLYVSAAAGSCLAAMLAWRAARMTDRRLDTRMPLRRQGDYLIAAVLPTAASVGLEMLGVWAQTPAMRALAALPLGLAVGWFLGRHAAELPPFWSRL